MNASAPLGADCRQAPAGNPNRFGGRWRLLGAGLSNIWRYGNLELPAHSGRLLMRGPNGTGKTTALEILWPFLLDLDKAKLRAGQARNTTLSALMSEGSNDKKRIGYVWLTFASPDDQAAVSYGARLVYSQGSTPPVKVEPFTIPGEPIKDMSLTAPGSDRSAITTAEMFRHVVEDAGGTVFKDEEDYLNSLANHVFNTARSDLVALADRIRIVRNPALLKETSAKKAAEYLRQALPGVAHDIVEATGEALAATNETRAVFERDLEAAELLASFAEVWSGHVVDVAGRLATAAQDRRAEQIRATQNAERIRRQHGTALDTLRRAVAAKRDVGEQNDRVKAELDSILKSPAYASIGRLEDLGATAAARQETAQARIGELETFAAGLNQRGNQIAEECTRLAENVAATVAEAVGHDRLAADAAPVLTPLNRPHAILLVGEQSFDAGPVVDLTEETTSITAAVQTWRSLASGHEAREAKATLMLNEHKKTIKPAMEEAAQKARDADMAERAADEAALERDRAAEHANQAATAIAAALTRWAAENPRLTETADADALDGESVTAAAAEGPAALLGAATEWQETAGSIARKITIELRLEAEGLQTQARDRRAEAETHRRTARELRSGRDIAPPRPDWAGSAGQDSFAAVLQWKPGTDDTTMTLIESALAGAGLLGASISAGTEWARPWAVTAASTPVQENLTQLLAAEEGHHCAEEASAVLERIAVARSASAAPPEAAAVVGTDGSFRFGVISGRVPGADHPASLPPPSFIGAAQRRRAALAEAARLESDAAELENDADQLDRRADELRTQAVTWGERVESFPNLGGLRNAEDDRVSAARWAAKRRAAADAASGSAEQARTQAEGLVRQWRAQLISLDLPTDPDGLDEARSRESRKAQGLRWAATALNNNQSSLLNLRSRIAAQAQDRARLPALRSEATAAHNAARSAALLYEQMKASHGKAATELSERLQLLEQEQAAGGAAMEAARAAENAAVAEEAKLGQAADDADVRAAGHAPQVELALNELRGLLAISDAGTVILQGAAPAAGNEVIAQVLDAVKDRPTRVRKTVADKYEDVRARLRVWAIDRTDGYGDLLDTYQCSYDGAFYTPLAAAELATELVDRAQNQLHQAEEAALRDFIVGRLPSAINVAFTELRDWIAAVNSKMKATSASSGVGVQVKVALREDLSHTQRTVHRLACTRTAANRSPEEDAELASALKALLNESSGETDVERVSDAVNIREWVRVDYLVHRPTEDKPQRWTSKTGLSTGELRLVVLAPMLASIAALHDSLPARGLRLAALDEVPIDVDDYGREGLARYIAELDLDVICTSYGWDGAPGAWDGVDAHDLEVGPNGIVVAFPMLVRGSDPLPGDPDFQP